MINYLQEILYLLGERGERTSKVVQQRIHTLVVKTNFLHIQTKRWFTQPIIMKD